MKGKLAIAVLFLGAISACNLCADMVAPAELDRGPAPRNAAQAKSPSQTAKEDNAAWPLPVTVAPVTLPPAEEPAETAGETSLSDGHDSLSLFVAAFGWLSAWQVARSLKKVHLSHIPDWYHCGGPAQIGHATPLELTSEPAVCQGAVPTDPPLLLRWVLDTRPLFPRTQFFCAVRAPRAPPFSA